MSGPKVRRFPWAAWLAAAGLFLQPPQAQAVRFCFVDVSAVAFGNYQPGTPVPVDSTGWVRIRCFGFPSQGQAGFYTIRIDGGTSSDPANRYMPSGSSQLHYNLFQDPGLTTVWGDGTSGTSPFQMAFPVIGGMGMGMGFPAFFVNRIHTVYGRSFAGQDPSPGAYSDTPVVTIEF